ncbi:MAG: alanine:cation symporter family protein, partial [Pseudomonadota bacterium]
QSSEAQGVTLTANAFATLLGSAGTLVVVLSIVCFAMTTLFTYAFYGNQCAGFLCGARGRRVYQWVFVGFVLISAVITVEAAINIIDTAFALMAIPTMVSALWLAPKVMRAADQYFTDLAAKR